METEIEGNSGVLKCYISQSSSKVKHAGQGNQLLIANFGFPIVKPIQGTDLFHKELIERVANQSGWTVVSLVCSGLGGSSGSFSPMGWCDDIETVSRYFVESTKVKSVLLVGYDFSADVCLAVAARSEFVRGVATVSPIISLESYIDNPLQLAAKAQGVGVKVPRKSSELVPWSDQLREISPIESANRLKDKEWLVIHGRDDEQVREGELRDFLNIHGSAAESHFVSAADHQLVTDPRMVAILLGWMERNN